MKIPYNILSGRLILADDSFQVTLFNPFSGKSIHFPPLKTLIFEKRYWDEFDEMLALPDLQIFEYEKRMCEECDEEDMGEYEPDLPHMEYDEKGYRN